MPEFIEDLKIILSSHTSLVDAKQSLDILFTNTPYGCQKNYPVAIVHESRRIKEQEALAYFTKNHLLDEKSATHNEYDEATLQAVAKNTPKYIQRVGFMLSYKKEVPEPTFFNKFKHDYWKKLTSSEGLEAVIDISALTSTTCKCEGEEALRSIIRKRKEVHQLKKIAFVWIVEIVGENSEIEMVMAHYFKKDTIIVKNEALTYYIGWSHPLQMVNMRYFLCPPNQI